MMPGNCGPMSFLLSCGGYKWAWIERFGAKWRQVQRLEIEMKKIIAEYCLDSVVGSGIEDLSKDWSVSFCYPVVEVEVEVLTAFCFSNKTLLLGILSGTAPFRYRSLFTADFICSGPTVSQSVLRKNEADLHRSGMIGGARARQRGS